MQATFCPPNIPSPPLLLGIALQTLTRSDLAFLPMLSKLATFIIRSSEPAIASNPVSMDHQMKSTETEHFCNCSVFG